MKDALAISEKYGKPWESTKAYHDFEQEWMDVLYIGKECGIFDVGNFQKIYCNRVIKRKLILTFQVLFHMGLWNEIKTFDGCFNVRKIRGKEDEADAWSIHSFGLALDFNASEMPLGSPSKWTPEFVNVWRALGWSWGGDWDRLDCQHFQHTEIA